MSAVEIVAPKPVRAKKTKQVKRKVEIEDEGETCLICANPIQFGAIGSCNHLTCHRCTFRQRALYSKKQCLICRTESDYVVFTDNLEIKDYNEYSAKDFVKYDEKHTVQFTQEYIYNETMKLLAYNCGQCSDTFNNFKDLSNHAKAVHNKFYCIICSKNKTSFITELPLFTSKQLQKHQLEGEAKDVGDQTGFKGHPECKHCPGKRFYSVDELNIHVRDKHERCHICDQYSPKTADYYKDYNNLYQHFKRDHYVCLVPLCVEKRFVVFRDDLDLTSHMLKEHGGVGSSAKIIIGSGNNSRHFSQLSTFNNRFLEANNNQEDHKSHEVRKRRFEERAKHYLSYKPENFTKFKSLNSSYRSKSITARELLEQYKLIFTEQTTEELSFLLVEFVEFFPDTTDLYHNLKGVIGDLEIKQQIEQFPTLGATGLPTTNTNALWVRSGSPSSSRDSFPALARPTPSPRSNSGASTPIRYTSVITKAAQPKPKVNSAPSTYVPSYLKTTTTTKRVSPAPVVALPDSKYPTLEKKNAKKPIPRVNPVTIPDPTQWGTVSAPSSGTSTPVEEDYEVDKRGKKQKKKLIIFGT